MRMTWGKKGLEEDAEGVGDGDGVEDAEGRWGRGGMAMGWRTRRGWGMAMGWRAMGWRTRRGLDVVKKELMSHNTGRPIMGQSSRPVVP